VVCFLIICALAIEDKGNASGDIGLTCWIAAAGLVTYWVAPRLAVVVRAVLSGWIAILLIYVGKNSVVEEAFNNELVALLFVAPVAWWIQWRSAENDRSRAAKDWHELLGELKATRESADAAAAAVLAMRGKATLDEELRPRSGADDGPRRFGTS
jgi:hypothetical protein